MNNSDFGSNLQPRFNPETFLMLCKILTITQIDQLSQSSILSLKPDKFPHEICIRKLQNLGTGCSQFKILSSHLYGQKQYACKNEEFNFDNSYQWGSPRFHSSPTAINLHQLPTQNAEELGVLVVYQRFWVFVRNSCDWTTSELVW